MGWDGRAVQKGGDICILLADHIVVQQKPGQYYKATILQLKINF